MNVWCVIEIVGDDDMCVVVSVDDVVCVIVVEV